MCVACGYDGPELQPDDAVLLVYCPRCDADLYERPPRSYAELEGLEDPGMDAYFPPRRSWFSRQCRLLRDWVLIWLSMVRSPHRSTPSRRSGA